jgi:flavin reductase
VLREDFVESMSRAAATVSVVTPDDPGGRAGVTVSAMSSVSAGRAYGVPALQEAEAA